VVVVVVVVAEAAAIMNFNRFKFLDI
jgi:hypothetical protein